MAKPLHASTVIRGGNIYDGTGSPPFVADVAIDGETIVAVGPNLSVVGTASEFDARGFMVAPGWIDVHTHYDAQCTWDPLLTPSAHCGVTTAIMGNCGVGFAPCQKELRPFLLDLMEAVEDIPGAALSAGIQWEWESFPEYLDALERRSFACDVAVMVGHGGVRTWVLGRRASVSDRPGGPERDPVTDDEIEAMATVVHDAVAAGALGFSTSRLLLHRDIKGVLTPGCLAAKKEMMRICDAVADGGGGVFEMSADFAVYDDVPYHMMDEQKKKDHFQSELAWMAEAMDKHNEKLRVTFGCDVNAAKFWSKWSRKVSKMPGQCVIQFNTRPQAFHLAHSSGKNMFSLSETYRDVRKACGGYCAKFLEALKDPSVRSDIMKDMVKFKPSEQGKSDVVHLAHRSDIMFDMYTDDKGKVTSAWMITCTQMYPWVGTYEPLQESMVAITAERTGRTPIEVAYDYLLDVEGPHRGVLWRPIFGYSGSNDSVVKALECDFLIPGFDDAGAHNTILTDATCTTSNLSYYGSQRTRGRTVPLERVVKVQTSDAAALFGLTDRGVIAPGKRADINIIDLAKLGVKAPYWANDLPTDAGRWVQYAEGYRATFLRGVETFCDNQHTGEFPGRLVRNPLRAGLVDDRSSSVKAFSAAEDEQSFDLTGYAVEVSRRGGASAVARVLREEEKLTSRL